MQLTCIDIEHVTIFLHPDSWEQVSTRMPLRDLDVSVFQLWDKKKSTTAELHGLCKWILYRVALNGWL